MSEIREKFIGRATTLVGDRRSTLSIVLKGKSLDVLSFHDLVMLCSCRKINWITCVEMLQMCLRDKVYSYMFRR